jgi:hypothetical protein
MLQILYLLAFVVLLSFTVVTLVRNIITLGREARRPQTAWQQGQQSSSAPRGRAPHPEFLDESGNVVNEPLLVMKSVKVEDIRDRLDALYDASPGGNTEESPEE